MSKPNLTLEFAKLLHDWEPGGHDVRQMCHRLLVDGLAVAVAGSQETGPSLMAALASRDACARAATVIGKGFETSAGLAARINGMSMHVLDFEPMWSPSNHALSSTLPALLALAESRERKGAEPQGESVLRALAKGIEAQGRLRLASRQLDAKDLRFHPPGIVGPIACAVACGDLLGLDEEKSCMAIGIAASRVSGLMQNIGSMVKALHCGDAAMHGLEAAELACCGFRSDGDALGGPRGYGSAYYGEDFDPRPLLGAIEVPRVLDPGPAWKLFPCQSGTHWAITAALECRGELANAGEIAQVRVRGPVMAYVDRQFPESGLAGKFSFQYCVAAALLDGKVDLASFTDARRFAPDMERMLARIHLQQDPQYGGRNDTMFVDVEVTLVGGSVLSKRCVQPEGFWSRPVTAERLTQKARTLVARTLGDARCEELFGYLDEGATANFSIRSVMSALH